MSVKAGKHFPRAGNGCWAIGLRPKIIKIYLQMWEMKIFIFFQLSKNRLFVMNFQTFFADLKFHGITENSNSRIAAGERGVERWGEVKEALVWPGFFEGLGSTTPWGNPRPKRGMFKHIKLEGFYLWRVTKAPPPTRPLLLSTSPPPATPLLLGLMVAFPQPVEFRKKCIMTDLSATIALLFLPPPSPWRQQLVLTIERFCWKLY